MFSADHRRFVAELADWQTAIRKNRHQRPTASEWQPICSSWLSLVGGLSPVIIREMVNLTLPSQWWPTSTQMPRLSSLAWNSRLPKNHAFAFPTTVKLESEAPRSPFPASAAASVGDGAD